MSFTYDPNGWPVVGGWPVPPDVQAVRRLLQDTDQRAHDVEDEEIRATLGAFGASSSGTNTDESVLVAVALRIAEDLLARTARLTDEAGAGINVTRSQRHQQWRDVIRQLQRRVQRRVGPSFVGGSKAKIAAAAADTDYRQPQIDVGVGRPK